ncbi:uncharacterized protein N7469_010198 [Penicillium citrinum]|uniref:2EXR domain-containing protein n=1 Tax=Penicillium citrinum TaxID=5077 RepID=A0A9W9NJT9_PENCI|nr:uncharacterized protein N7469_010198 [Penicillium citrinum]KAJ5221311.1 hypothetical protein N7469_010198 [Penicillium citrinum]
MSDRTFHYFPKLPVEIRVMIWELCLPNRVAEYDGPWFLHDGFRARQACYSKSIIQRNSRIPKISSVSYEAREVTLRSGKWWELSSEDDYPWLDSIWVQPHHDMLHLNWVRHCWAVYASNDHPPIPGKIGPFLLKAAELGMHNFSVAADTITPFRLDLLVGGYVPLDMIEDFVGDQITHVEDLFDFGDAAYDDDLPREMGVAMVAISLHVREDAAHKSGLFGLLGEEPVQMIDADDNTRLGKYEEFFHRYTIENAKEPKVMTLFELFRTSKFREAVRAWQKEAERLLLEDFWEWARYCDLISDDEPIEEQPFMQEAKKLSFRTRPQIMIRYCTNQCYMKENLPDGFGD